MNETFFPVELKWRGRASGKPAVRLARKIMFNLLAKLEVGRITICDGESIRLFGSTTSEFPLSARITIRDPRAYTFMAFGGSIGTAEAYMLQYWGVDDLTNLVRIVIRNQTVFYEMETGLARLTAPLHKGIHALRQNSLAGSRRNILAHYDLGNEFYRLFLDETMTYSCGIFERPDATLKEAALAKYDRICRKLNLSAQDHLLEIGTGWGGFALHAAKYYGCRVTTTTISDQQYTLAKQRIEAAGFQSSVTLLKSDYRQLRGRFDKLVSIEMIEAVGDQYLDTFMARCAGLLKPDGVMLIQAITIADWAYDRHKKSVDFIKRYIFPGSCIPSVTAISNALARATDLRLFHLEDITPHYATTLRKWRENFIENLEQVRLLGFSETFIRMWEYYLRYCEAGFEERYLGNVQMVFAKPLTRMPVGSVQGGCGRNSHKGR